MGSFSGEARYARDGGLALERIYQREQWRPIPGCDGRYVYRGPRRSSVLENEPHKLVRLREASESEDGIVVGLLRGGGGVLSYEKFSGVFVHTLGTASGLIRKVAALNMTTAILRELDGRGKLLFRVVDLVLRCIADPERTRLGPAASAAVRVNCARAAYLQ